MELELALQLLLQGLPAIAQIFTALQEERIVRLKHLQAQAEQAGTLNLERAKTQNNLDRERWSFEQEKFLQQQLSAYDRETQLNLASYQRETALKLPEITKIFENWPLRLLPSQILQSHSNELPIPLRIFIAPPKVQAQEFGELAQAMPEIELNLAQGMGEFLNQNYPLHSLERPTEFLPAAWEPQRFHRESSIKALFSMLKSEPTLILESEIVGEFLNFRIAYWGLGQKNYSYQTILDRMPYRDIIYNSAKKSALEWKKTAELLLHCGETLEVINQMGGDRVINLQILEKEEKWKQCGIDISNLPLSYKVNKKDFDALTDFLTTCHCLVAASVADAHHLMHYDISPLLPELLPALTKDLAPGFVQKVMHTTISGYRDIFKSLEEERPLQIPELALKLAQSLANLPNKSYAQEQLNYSLQTWLKQHHLTADHSSNSLAIVQSSLTGDDRKYLDHLKDCLTTLNDERGVAQVNRLLDLMGALNNKPSLERVALTKIEEPESFIPFACSLNQRQSRLENVSLAHTLTGHSGKAASIAVSFDGDIIASGSDDATIKLWHLETGELLRTFNGNSGRVLSIALSPDGQILASSHKTSDRSSIKIWNWGTGEQLHTLIGHHKWIYSLAIAPDRKTLVSGGYKIKTWDLTTGKPLHTFAGHKRWVYSLAISPDGETLISSGGDKSIKIWHLKTGELLETLNEHLDLVRAVALSPDGKILASGSDDHTIKLWDLETGKSIRTLTGHTDWVLSLSISPAGDTLISGSKDNTIKLWNLPSGKLLGTLTAHQKAVYSLAISPDGQTLASGSEDKTIKIWRAV